jgi:hypothetical protein
VLSPTIAVAKANLSDDANLKKIKDYADYASKVWAGVLALLVALVALKK